jgi:protein SCO1
MTDKKKIILIYVGVAVISLLILGMSFLLAGLRKEKRRDSPPAVEVGKEQVDEMAVLEADIELEKQDGSRVMISDLNDKVWLAVQFYAACPMCAERNAKHLLEVYNEFKGDDDFVVACFSVDPEDDTSEKLADVRDRLNADPKNWWFLKTDREKLWDFMTEKMFFTTILERFEPAEIAAKGRWAHDLGIQVYRGNTLVHKWDEGLPLDQLRDEIKEALRELKEPKS